MKKRTTIYFGSVFLCIAIFFVAFSWLKHVSLPNTFLFLKDCTAIDSGLVMQTDRGDVLEPKEYEVYTWDQTFPKAKFVIGQELASAGFSLVVDKPDVAYWRLRDVEIVAHRQGVSPVKQLKGASAPYESTQITIGRWLKNSSLTQFRIWLFDPKDRS